MKKILLLLVALLTISSIVFAKGETQPYTDAYLKYLQEQQNRMFGIADLNGANSQYVNGALPARFSHGAEPTYLNTINLPSAFSLVEEGNVTSVKDQNPWGTCWAFATIASAESNMLVKGAPKTIDYSELDLAWRGTIVNDDFDYENVSEVMKKETLNKGGDVISTILYYFKNDGNLNEEYAPYVAPYLISNNRPNNSNNISSVSYLGDITIEETRNFIKEYIYKTGGVFISYSHDDNHCKIDSNYTSFYNHDAERAWAGHSVTIVGWDDNFPSSNFVEDPKDYVGKGVNPNGAWLCKNEWGTAWGKEGYYWISYHEPSLNDAAGFQVNEVNERYNISLFPGRNAYLVIGYTYPYFKTYYNISKSGYIEAVGLGVNYTDTNISVKVYLNDKLVDSINKDKVLAGYKVFELDEPIRITNGDSVALEIFYEVDNESKLEKKLCPGSVLKITSKANTFYSKKDEEDEWEDIGKDGEACTAKLICSDYVPCDDVEIKDEEIYLTVGQKYNIDAKLIPSDATVQTLNYDSDDSKIASVSDKGIITAKGYGQTTIYVKHPEDITKTITVNVYDRVTGFEVSPDEANLYYGLDGYDIYEIHAKVYPETANQDVEYNCVNNSIEVEDGIVSIVNPRGTEENNNEVIVKTVGLDGKGNQIQKVINFHIIVPVTGITMQSSKEAQIGESFKLDANIAPFNATNTKIKWKSSNKKYATVDEKGVVTPLVPTGNNPIKITATITDKFEDIEYEQSYTATCLLTVVAKPKSIVLCSDAALENPLSNFAMNLGQTYKVYPKITPAEVEEQYSEVRYSSSDNSVLSISSNGVIRALKVGKATIKAKTITNGKTCSYVVTVRNYPAQSVELDNHTLTLLVNGSSTLTATVKPTSARNKNVLWSSSDTSVATVDNGKVYAVNEGNAIITVKTVDGGYTDRCIVTVKKIPVSYVDIYKFANNLKVGKTYKFVAKAYPTNASFKTITWSSSNTNVATIATDGTVTALKNGTCKIIASCDGKSSSIILKVANKIDVKSVKFTKNSVKVKVGNSIDISSLVKITPEKATYKDVTYKSSNKRIATVDSKGKVKGISKGTATIKVTSVDNPKAYDTITVKVY